jgi:hypothetical protein
MRQHRLLHEPPDELKAAGCYRVFVDTDGGAPIALLRGSFVRRGWLAQRRRVLR